MLLTITVVAAVIGFFGAKFALAAYNADKEQKEKQEAKETERDLDLKKTREQLDLTHRELSVARARADAIEALQSRRLAKQQVVGGRIADAINIGGGLRYALETARNAAIAEVTLSTFDLTFDTTEHAKDIEKWRDTTAKMLEHELPSSQLRPSFSDIDGGVRIGSRSAYQLGRILACLEWLRGLQRELRSHVELAIH